MPNLVRRLCAVITAVAVVAVPTGSIAAAPPTPAPKVQQAAAAASTNPWLTLSAMTGSSSSAAAATAAAANDGGEAGFPPLAPLMVMLGTIALGVWILVHDDNGHFSIQQEPVSPA
ncbi:hypothetical protein LZ496_00930 [Sphingomonas sp. NSE70-1]|uniref:Secreted protein n=1 Tax=Sphingomonas caseinilyticus TaxID=2908205 RepID=A0ABT0RR17_9SPHN|nr:hypothetical protein [Sphingomonas caseinilyticus]MCL6697356.1 hypothetical protein [Sphingomonas caseinilyticus]